MKINITSKQYKNFIINESLFDEESRNLSKKEKETVYNAGQQLANDLYGDKFGKENQRLGDFYNIPNYKDDADIKSGLFSVGNQKLSPDTLIINFTSAFACPSREQCPISQCACYAVAGENRLKGTRSKNVKVHRLVTLCRSQKKLPQFFNIAKLYIDLLKNSKKPIKWVRFNEAGDFPNQETVDLATQFAKDVEAKYGVKCMAYTANGRLDFREASKAIAINASTNKVLSTIDDSSPKRNFFGIKHNHFDYDFISDKYDADYEQYKAEHNLQKSGKADETPIETIDKLPINGTTNNITIPILQYGKWGNAEDEQGYYYVCPCSFWKDRKDQIEFPYCEKYLNKPPYDIKHLRKLYPKTKNKYGKMVDHPIVRELTKQLNQIKSPCGVSCAVCHDRQGGIDKETGKKIKDYAILTAIHGSTSKNFNPLYAHAKRIGDDSVKYSEENPLGLWTAPDRRG
jgi:hypothetical protein